MTRYIYDSGELLQGPDLSVSLNIYNIYKKSLIKCLVFVGLVFSQLSEVIWWVPHVPIIDLSCNYFKNKLAISWTPRPFIAKQGYNLR